MKPATGQMLRRTGLGLEALCLLGLLSIQRDPGRALEVARLSPMTVLKFGFALGLLLWGIGTAAIHWPKRAGDMPET